MKLLAAALLVMMFCLESRAQDSVKEYQKTFLKEGIQELVLSNQYGKIKISQTDGMEINVSVEIKVDSKSVAKSDETKAYIDVKDGLNNGILDIQTVFTKDMKIKQFLTSTSIKIDYMVEVPRGIKLRVITSDGDVSLGDFEGEINADVKNGDFKAGIVKGEELYIKQINGAFGVEEVNVLTGDFSDCSILIVSGNEVKMTAKNCDGKLESVENLNIRTSGGVMKLGEIEQMTGSASATKFEIQDIGNLLDVDMKFGEINVRNIHFDFSEVRLKGSFTKVGLTFMKDAGYQLEIKHNKALKMDIPREIRLDERPTTERNTTIGTAFVGNKERKGKVMLDLSSGNMYIQ